MITVEIQCISRLEGHICIPSMVECTTPKDTTLQKILYSSLPNQCRKCRHFDHFTHACTISKVLIWDGTHTCRQAPNLEQESDKRPCFHAPKPNHRSHQNQLEEAGVREQKPQKGNVRNHFGGRDQSRVDSTTSLREPRNQEHQKESNLGAMEAKHPYQQQGGLRNGRTGSSANPFLS